MGALFRGRVRLGPPTLGPMANVFTRAMKLMRKHDPQLQEDGFGLLLPHAAAHLDALIAAHAQERDYGLRCWLLELIAEARSPETIDFLAAQLHSPDDCAPSWAAHGLRLIDTKESRTILHWSAALPEFERSRCPSLPVCSAEGRIRRNTCLAYAACTNV